MADKERKRTMRLAKLKWVKYTKATIDRSKKDRSQEEAINVTQFVEKINRINLSPRQLRELGLPSDWQKGISVEFIEKVVKTAERYRKDLRELSKR